MVGGGISIDGHMDLVRGNLTSLGYIEKILLQHMLVATYVIGPEFILMHDNPGHHPSCPARSLHSRDGMASSES